MKLFFLFLCLRIYHNNFNSWYYIKFKFCTYWNGYLRTKTIQRQNITSLWVFSNGTSKSSCNVDHNIYNTCLRALTSPPLSSLTLQLPPILPHHCVWSKRSKRTMNNILKMGVLKKQETLGLLVLELPFQGPAQKMTIQRAAVGELSEGGRTISCRGLLWRDLV
jgi:hypothetical protein